MREYQHVIQPAIPPLDPARVEDLKKERNQINLVGLIETMNLDACLPPLDRFLKGIPDLSELARIRHLSAKELDVHLGIESCFWTIAKIRIEKTAVPVARKTYGYVSTNPTILRALQDRTERLMEMEYRRRFTQHLSAPQIYELFRFSLDGFDGTPMGQLLRLYGAIFELSKRVSLSPWVGTDRFHTIVERTLWRRASLKWQGRHGRDGTPSTEKARGSVRKPATQGAAAWENSFEFLGPFLACRLLLRGERLSELECWIDQNDSHPELPRIYCDAALARDWLVDRGFTEKQIHDLDRILAKLNKRMQAMTPQSETGDGVSETFLSAGLCIDQIEKQTPDLIKNLPSGKRA